MSIGGPEPHCKTNHDSDQSKGDSMNNSLILGLLLVSVFAGLWAAFYAHRAYQNTKKIMDKMGR
jgi:hypothetical protein